MDELDEDIARFLEGFKGRLESALYEFPLRKLSIDTPLFFPPHTPLKTVVETMGEKKKGCVLVGSPENLQGIFTERDLLYRFFPRSLPLETPVEAIMTKNPYTLPLSARIVHALHLMAVYDFRHIPVRDEKKRIVGVVSVKDIIHFLTDLFPAEILNIPP
jgi:CBS domain-containing protein